MKNRYVQVSTKDQVLNLQINALKKACCNKMFQEIAKGINYLKAVRQITKFILFYVLITIQAYANHSTISADFSETKPIMLNKQKVTPNEHDIVEQEVINKAIKLFAAKMKCIIPTNKSLEKWGAKGNRVKYSIGWQQQCGPIIDGVYQLGDNGKGSTFVCEHSTDSVCCWPLGYGRIKEYVICTDYKFKK